MNTGLFIAKRILNGGSGLNKSMYAGSRTITRIAVGGIALGMAVMILTIAIVTGFQNTIRDKVIGFASNIAITNHDTNSSYEAVPVTDDEQLKTLLAHTPGIKHVQVFATKSGLVKTKTNCEGVVFKGIAKDYDWTFIRENLVEGNLITISDSAISKEVVISKSLASRLELKLKDKLIVYFITKKKGTGENNWPAEYEQRVRDFRVSGIYDSGMEEYDKKMAFVDLRHIQKLNYWDSSQVAGFEVSINDVTKMEKMGEIVDDLVGQGLVAQTARQQSPSIFVWLDSLDTHAIIITRLMILIAVINMISALLILILERTNMIGILKALGFSNKGLQQVFLYTAASLIGRGLIIGNILGIALCYMQQYFGLLTLDKNTYYVSVVPVNINFFYFALLNAGTIAVCMVMMLLPTLVISKITPVKAIRFS